MIRRRQFISLLGGAAAAWPVAARAQSPARMRFVGVLLGSVETTTMRLRLTAFLQEFKQLGWTDGQNVRIVLRWGGSNPRHKRESWCSSSLTL